MVPAAIGAFYVTGDDQEDVVVALGAFMIGPRKHRPFLSFWLSRIVEQMVLMDIELSLFGATPFLKLVIP